MFKNVETFNDHNYYKKFAYKVSDNEAIKLNLLTKMK